MTVAADPAAPLWFLVGPTASGKKRVALELAERLHAGLLSLDSIKVYRGMDLGTDKSEAGAFGLTDLADPSERFSVGAWVREAGLAVDALRARGRIPWFVGGTGLYLRALVRGLFDVPAIEPAVRQEVAERGAREGAPALHRELARVDPATARRLHANDLRRIVRALEIHRQTGRALSDWQATATCRPIAGVPVLVGLRWNRPKLRERIAVRVARMFERGLVEEVAALVRGGRIGPVAGSAIGYREVVALLERGESDSPAARARCIDGIVADTVAFVRRQDNWFRHFPEIRWVDAEAAGAGLADAVAAEFLRR